MFVFNFLNEESQQRVLKGGPCTFNQRPMFLKPWKPLMNLDLCSIQRVLICVKLPLLPWELWSVDILSRIGSILGTPLFTDQCTLRRERLKFARVLVEMDIHGDYPDSVVLEDDEGSQITQLVEYEWRPIFYSTCKGDGRNNCPNNQRGM